MTGSDQDTAVIGCSWALTVFVTFGQRLQVVYMVVVVTWSTQDFEREVPDDGRGSGQTNAAEVLVGI